jgi:hypothetical protein
MEIVNQKFSFWRTIPQLTNSQERIISILIWNKESYFHHFIPFPPGFIKIGGEGLSTCH